MNAGAWGMELKDVLLSVALMKEDGEIVERPRTAFDSLIEDWPFPLLGSSSRTVSTEKGKEGRDPRKSKKLFEMRKKRQPLDYPSAGSIFKNPKEGPCREMDRRDRAERVQDGTGDDLRPSCQFHHQSGKGYLRRGDPFNGVGGEEDTIRGERYFLEREVRGGRGVKKAIAQGEENRFADGRSLREREISLKTGRLF